MHATGANNSAGVQRMANLLQISSPFGVPMETIDHDRIQLACYKTLQHCALEPAALETLATVMSDSYPFPTNLDRDVPDRSLNPPAASNYCLVHSSKVGMRFDLNRRSKIIVGAVAASSTSLSLFGSRQDNYAS